MDFEEYDAVIYSGNPSHLNSDGKYAVWTDDYPQGSNINTSARIVCYNLEQETYSTITREDRETGVDLNHTRVDSNAVVQGSLVIYQSYDSVSKISSVYMYHMLTSLSVRVALDLVLGALVAAITNCFELWLI